MILSILTAQKATIHGLNVADIIYQDNAWIEAERVEFEDDDRRNREEQMLERDLRRIAKFIKLEETREPKALIVIDEDDEWLVGKLD